MHIGPLRGLRPWPPGRRTPGGRASLAAGAGEYARAGAVVLLLVGVIAAVAALSGVGAKSAKHTPTPSAGAESAVSSPTPDREDARPSPTATTTAAVAGATAAISGFPGAIAATDVQPFPLSPGFPGNIPLSGSEAGDGADAGPLPAPPALGGLPAALGSSQAPPAGVPPLVQPTPLPAVPAAPGRSPTPAIGGPAPIVNPAPVAQPVVQPVVQSVAAAPPITPSVAATPSIATPLPAMVIEVTLRDASGAILPGPRVQARFDDDLCADETAVSAAAESVRLTLPGACAALTAGDVVTFRVTGLAAARVPAVNPAPACAVTFDDAPPTLPVYAPVVYTPGASDVPVTLLLAGPQPLAGCPPDAGTVTDGGVGQAGQGGQGGQMTLSVAVRAADRADTLVAPSVRVYAGARLCAEAASSGAIVVQVTIPQGCGRGGDALSFEAAGLDNREQTPGSPAPACAFEYVFGAAAPPAPAYQPVTLTAGERFVALILATLPGCPMPGAPPAIAPPSDDMTLTLSAIDPATPAAPLDRPEVTVFVGATPCARAASLSTQQVALTLPRSCGAAGAPLSFRVSALDPRYQRSGDAGACAIVPPGANVSARTFQPALAPVTFAPGASATYALLLGAGCLPAPVASPIPASATLTATPTPPPATTTPAISAATASATPSPTPAPAPTPQPVGPGAAIFAPLPR